MKKREEDDRGGELMGLTGLETAKTALRREKTRHGGAEGREGKRQKRRDGRQNVGKSKCFLICSSMFPQLQVSHISPILALCV